MPEISSGNKRVVGRMPEVGAPNGFYFAYGSNLDLDDWSAFCRSLGADPGVIRPIGPAILPDEMLVFDYRSTRRQCGALNIRPAPGRSVEGGLFVVSQDGWSVLDHKEGHPHRYRRVVVRVSCAGGRIVRAATYRVTPERRAGFTPPSAEYLSICRAGRRRFGLSDADLDRAAAGNGAGITPPRRARIRQPHRV